jgi:hypothetical protein
MKTWHKILIVCGCGAAVWGLSYCAGLWTTYSLVFASFSAGITALCGILTGFTGAK